MSKRKERREKAELFTRVQGAATRAEGEGAHEGAGLTDDVLAASPAFAGLITSARRELPRMKKFRFQLLHEWIATHLEPGRMADVGG
ncbi:MAG TPA: hypothetical protein PK530_21250, partial [Anaerolineales bacterium]|nr:hypothetical protein [Anaerolineales bacterium]